MIDHQKSSTSRLVAKLLAIREEVSRVSKNGVNAYQNYRYVAEADVNKVFAPVLNKHRVFLFTSILERQAEPHNTGWLTTIKLQVTFIDTDSGEQLSSIFFGDGWDKGDKGIFKAITGALKYALMKTFLVTTGDDPEQEDTGNHQSNITNHNLPSQYEKLKAQAQSGEAALYQAWNTLSLQEKRELYPYRKTLKQIANQAQNSTTDRSNDNLSVANQSQN